MCFHVCAVFYNVTSRFPLPEYFYLLCPLWGAWTQTWSWVQSAFFKTSCRGDNLPNCSSCYLHSPPRVTTACQCLHVFSWLSIAFAPSSFLEMARPKCLHALDPKAEHQQFDKRCHSGLPHHLQHPLLLLYCQICISEPRAAVVPTSLCSASLWLTSQGLTITSQCKAVFVLNSCSWLMQRLALYNLSL